MENLKIISRNEWGCPDGEVSQHGKLVYTNVTHIIIHHTANENQANDWAEIVRNIWHFHTIERGYADIGYNYLIDPNGVIYEGRAGGDNVQGAHFSSVNPGTLGVAIIGTYTEMPPLPPAIESLLRLLKRECLRCGIDPEGKSLHDASNLMLHTISGHRDGPRPTECPGEAFYSMFPQIRKAVVSCQLSVKGDFK